MSQCTGLKNIPPADNTAFIQTLPAELVANMPQRPVIKHGMAMAAYSPVSDVVNMPDPARFKSEVGAAFTGATEISFSKILLNTWSLWKRFPGDSHQDLELLRRERARGRRTLFRAGKMPKEE